MINPERINNAFTLDVEDYFHVSAFEKAIDRSQWESYPSRVVKNTHVILNLLNDKSIQGTFFVLGWVAERHPELVREIVAAGHEVASHGYSHRLVYRQSPSEFFQETERSKKVLEDITGVGVVGYRAASYSITRKSLWALDMLAELGFDYDSSIFPVAHDRYGIANAPRFPHRVALRNGATIKEFPLTTFHRMGVNLPVAGGGYFRLLPYFLTKYGLSSVNERDNKPFIFYLHPWEVDTGQPKIKAGLVSTFRHYQNLKSCERKLKALLSQFQFSTVSRVFDDIGDRQLPLVDVAHYEKKA